MTKFATIFISSLMIAAASASEGHHAMPLNAQPIFQDVPGLSWISNSMVMVWAAVLVICAFCQIATKKMALVPEGLQNVAEWAVESLYDFLEGLMGEHLIKRVFWFFGTIFFFILTCNYMGLVPGVGTWGQWVKDAHGHEQFVPYLRGANADVNMTAAMAFSFAVLWFYWAITENGIVGFIKHIFAPKGEFKGFLLVMMVPIFLFVGVLELISIGVRPVALTFRLFGNIYGGEQTLESLMALIPESMRDYLCWLPALPFCFMELLVGFVQALVFTLLCAIFLKLICDHGEEAHH